MSRILKMFRRAEETVTPAPVARVMHQGFRGAASGDVVIARRATFGPWATHDLSCKCSVCK